MLANAQCPVLCRFRLIAAGVGLSWQSCFPRPKFAWALVHSNFRFLPAVDDVAPYFAASDAYVSNCKRGGETWGLLTLEAATSGLVVLASGVGGTLEQLEHNVTAMFHEGGQSDSDSEAEELAANMCAVAQDAGLALRLAASGRAFATSRLGQAQVEEALVALFNSCELRRP